MVKPTRHPPIAVVTGIGGQDGSYLAEQLLSNGYRVIGLARRSADAYPSIAGIRDRLEFEQIDLLDHPAVAALIRKIAPAELYHLAARASSADLFTDPAGIGMINGILVARILEAIRLFSPATRFCQAGSSEIFGTPDSAPQNEQSAFRPRNPYGAAKLFAHVAVQTYRQKHGLFACGAILFNHESPRRGIEMVTRKIAHAVARAHLGLNPDLRLGNLEARRDWGFAGDYMRALWLMLQNPVPDDYVIASGELHSVRELCEIAFSYVGLDYRPHVIVDPSLFRASEPVPLHGDPSRARTTLGWLPETGFEAMVHAMVDAEIAHLQNHES